MKRLAYALFLVVLVASLLPTSSVFGAQDWDVTGGHFFTQTGGSSGKGYVVGDDGGVRFWSEFKRLGGVQAVGYPASQRFTWDGFTVQVFQRVIFQWRPETQSVAFVNVFDRLSELAKDEWLLRVRQTPHPIKLDEQGKSWSDVVKGRLALLSDYPAIRAKYYEVVGDAIQANGLPTSAVTDMGNHYALRCQRVVFQQWKEDVPWARKGMVTVALGGDIAKETGILPNPSALQPTTPEGASSGTGTSTQWARHDDSEKSFKYPAGWRPLTLTSTSYAFNYYVDYNDAARDLRAFIAYMAPFRMGPDFKVEDFLKTMVQALHDRPYVFDAPEATTINGNPAVLQPYRVPGYVRGLAGVIKYGANVYYIDGIADEDKWSTYEPLLRESIRSFVAKRAD